MSKDLSADGVAPEEWKPLHPLTYLPRVLGSVTGIIGAVTLANASALAAWLSGETPTGIESGIVFLGLAVIAVVILAVSGLYSYLAWRMTRYAVTSTAVWYRAGILMRTQRHARVSRIQTVNVSYSLLGRIVGLGYLDIEVAGGQDSSIKLGLLTSRRLEELRALLPWPRPWVAAPAHPRSGPPSAASLWSVASSFWLPCWRPSTTPWRCFSVSSCSA